MDLAVVVYGAAVKNVITNDAYQARYGTDNPNLDLLEKLQERKLIVVNKGNVSYKLAH